MWKKIASENKTKKSRKSEKLTNPTRLCFLGSAMNGNKNTNKKNDENKIKNPNPNPIKEKREKKAIEKRFFLFV